MNNNRLEQQSKTISTMVAGLRDDVWHWRNSDVSQFSSEKLNSILRLAELARCEEDRLALHKVREELASRIKQLQRK